MNARRRKRDHSLGEGVYYEQRAYAGILRRLLVFVVDMAVLIFVWFTLSFVYMLSPLADGEFDWLTPALLLVGWLYLAVLKPSPIRTAGYWIARTKIVTLKGGRPSIFRMTFRLLLWMLAPINLLYLLDLLWVGIDDDRQTLRDRFAGTCVVKVDAPPIGRGDIHLAYYDALGFNLMYPRVTRPPILIASIVEDAPSSAE